jgi:hypothetical protein
MPVEHEFVAEIEVDDPFVLTDRQTEIHGLAENPGPRGRIVELLF